MPRTMHSCSFTNTLAVFAITSLFDANKVEAHIKLPLQIAINSTYSSDTDDAQSVASCTDLYPTLASCGLRSSGGNIDGSWTSWSSSGDCIAQNGNNNPGVAAQAICIDSNFTCEQVVGPKSSTYDDAISVIGCTSSDYQMISCSARSPHAAIDGSHVGSTLNLNHSIDTNTICSAYHDGSGLGVYAHGICCAYQADDGYVLQCKTIWGNSRNDGYYVSDAFCPSQYALLGCSGYSAYRDTLASYYKTNINSCKAKGANGVHPVYAIATCCRLYIAPTSSPTLMSSISPTSSPTSAPSAAPVSPTFSPSASTTMAPTQLNQYKTSIDDDGTYRWESITDFVPMQSASFGSIPIGEIMEIEFDFKWFGRTNYPRIGYWENFFRVGFDAAICSCCNGELSRYPSFWLSSGVDTMHVSVSSSALCVESQSLDAFGIITKGVSYHVSIAFNSSSIVVYVNDWMQPFIREPTSSVYIGQTAQIWWMSNQYVGTEYNAGNGTFSNIVLTSFTPTSSPTNAPTSTSSAPTLIPTIAPIPTTANPTLAPSSEPTLIPTLAPSISANPTLAPTKIPTLAPTKIPTLSPTKIPLAPTVAPPTTVNPTSAPAVASSVSYPATVCLWGQSTTNQYLIGEYIYSGIFHERPSYTKTFNESCYPKVYLFYYIPQNAWFITAALGKTTTYFARCTSDPTWPCTNLWMFGQSLQTNVRLFNGSCPKWECDAIQAEDISSQCNGLFDTKHDINVWSNSDQTYYFYFAYTLFNWICSDTYDPQACNINFNAMTDLSANGWIDLSVDQSTILLFSVPDSVYGLVSCIGHTTQDPTQNIPTTAPTMTPSNIFTTISPTSFPTDAPTIYPSISPTNTDIMPSLAVTDELILITTTSSTYLPASSTYSPTESLTKTPVSSIASTDEDTTIVPTNVLITTETASITSSLTAAPSASPTASYFDLQFICKYNDESATYYSLYISLSKYAQIMLDAILTSIQSVTYHSMRYEDGDIWQYAAWTQAGINEFKICSIFNDVQLETDCGVYDAYDSSEDDDAYEYIATATFGIIADQSLNRYKQYLVHQLTSEPFRNLFELNVNQGLYDAINVNSARRRSLLEQNEADAYFEVVSVQIIDSLNISITTTEYEDSQAVSSKDNVGTVIVICVVIVVSILIVIGLLVYVKLERRKKEEQKEGEIDNEIVELNRNDFGNVEGAVHDIIRNVDNRNDDDIVDLVNKTNNEQVNDDDVVAIINKTNKGKMADDNHDELSENDGIIAMINNTKDYGEDEGE